MYSKKIKLNTQNDVRDFCQTMGTVPRNISVKTKEHGYDCKSILGMISLNLSEPVEIIFVGQEKLDTNYIDNLVYPWAITEEEIANVECKDKM